jgi:hypothetical protein
MMIRKWLLCLTVLFLVRPAFSQECPVDSNIIFGKNEVVALRLFAIKPAMSTLNSLNQLPQTTIITERRLQVSGSVNASDSQGTAWSGVLLRDFLLKNGLENVASRSLRNTRIEIVAKDGYKATFSWGEIFNNPIGSQVLLITKQDGKYLDVQEGPLAIRSLGDIRPGARHVRNICAISVLN